MKLLPMASIPGIYPGKTINRLIILLKYGIDLKLLNLLPLCLLWVLEIKAQVFVSSDSSLSLSGYAEVYYSYDFGKPADNNRPPFIYSYNRANEVNLNIGMLRLGYETRQVRGAFALMAGTYTNANLAQEPGVLKNIFEANIGVRIARNHALWVDAGIMPSHIGSEGAIGINCNNLTRSIMADNSPYYETGIKISYTSPNKQWLLAGLLLNGWQRIQRPDGNSTPAFGHQLTFTPNERFTLNASSFVGNDKPDTAKQMRYFHSLYAKFVLHKRWQLLAAFDIGVEQQYKGSSDYNTWFTPLLNLRFQAAEKHFLSLRGEYYHDPDEVIITSGTPNGFQTWGFSINYDFTIAKNLVWRSEAKLYQAKDKVFTKEGEAFNKNLCLTSSLAFSF